MFGRAMHRCGGESSSRTLIKGRPVSRQETPGRKVDNGFGRGFLGWMECDMANSTHTDNEKMGKIASRVMKKVPSRCRICMVIIQPFPEEWCATLHPNLDDLCLCH